MVPPYERIVDRSTGKVQISPININDTPPIPTTGVPALGLTQDGLWIPFLLNSDGTLPAPGSMTTMVPHFDDIATDSTPGVIQELLNNTVPSNVTRYLSNVIVKTRVTGSFEVLANGSVIGSGRTGPGGSPNMNFNPMRPLVTGTVYEVQFTSRDDSAETDVECYVQSNDINT